MAWALIFPTFAGFITSLLPPWYFGGKPIICQHVLKWWQGCAKVIKELETWEYFLLILGSNASETIFQATDLIFSFHVANTFSVCTASRYHLISCHRCSIQVERYYQQQLGLKCLFSMLPSPFLHRVVGLQDWSCRPWWQASHLRIDRLRFRFRGGPHHSLAEASPGKGVGFSCTEEKPFVFLRHC